MNEIQRTLVEFFSNCGRGIGVSELNQAQRAFAEFAQSISNCDPTSVSRGTVPGDLLIFWNDKHPEEERLLALERIMKECGKPLHIKRWLVIGMDIGRTIAEDAKFHKVGSKEEFRNRVLTDLYLVSLDAAGNYSAREDEACLRALRLHLNKVFPEDILEIEWRRRNKRVDLIDEFTLTQPELARIELRLSLRAQGLKDREVELMLLLYEGQRPIDIADLWGVEPGTVRTLSHRTRKKLKKSASFM